MADTDSDGETIITLRSPTARSALIIQLTIAGLVWARNSFVDAALMFAVLSWLAIVLEGACVVLIGGLERVAMGIAIFLIANLRTSGAKEESGRCATR